MTNKELHENAMKVVRALRASNHYEEATEMMRMSCCKRLRLLKVVSVQEQGIDNYYSEGDILLSSGESFGDREYKRESYKSWNRRTKGELKSKYLCQITREPCVGRMEDFHSSDICEGDSNEVKLSLDIQMRCPAFKFREALLDKLKKRTK